MNLSIGRRSLMTSGVAALTVAPVPAGAAFARRLVAAPAEARLVSAAGPTTAVWAYDAVTPGPTFRYRRGERMQVILDNRLPVPTTIHWHGARLPNAMDGVPDLTQPPVPSGGRFRYEFDLLDAGTFWYHPHFGSPEQLGRGLYGPLIVEEDRPIPVDRDETWVLADWRLRPDGTPVEDFGAAMDASHAGRLGNTATVNGRVGEGFALRAGERLRLRLVNAANARIFALRFDGHAPVVVALDGHAVEPHAPPGGRVVLGPGERADLILDADGEPGRRYPVVDSFFAQAAYRVVDLAYSGEPPLRAARSEVTRPEDNPVPPPDLGRAERHRIVFGGGMMDPALMRSGATREGAMATMQGRMRRGMFWTVDGKEHDAHGHNHEPLARLALGRSYLFEWVNDTAWWHPIHLHGFAFAVVSRNGAPPPRAERRDTVLLAPGDRAEIAFVADNPGDWMLHCHVLEHADSGMMGIVRVG